MGQWGNGAMVPRITTVDPDGNPILLDQHV